MWIWWPGGLLGGLTKRVLAAGLEAELTGHLGYDEHDPAGRNGGNSRNGTRSKTVITEVGLVELAVPRDGDGSFEPILVRKRERRLGGVDELVIWLTATGFTTGEVQAHLAKVYRADVSRETLPALGGQGSILQQPAPKIYRRSAACAGAPRAQVNGSGLTGGVRRDARLASRSGTRVA